MTTVLFVAGLGSFLERFVSPLAQALREEGYRTVGAAESLGGAPGFDRCYDLPHYRRGSPSQIVAAQRALLSLARAESPDLLHLHTPPAIVLGRAASRVIGAPSISVIHTTFLEPFSRRTVAFAAVEAALARLSVATVTMNHDDAAFYRRIHPRGITLVAPVGGLGVSEDVLMEAALRPYEYPSHPAIVVIGRLTAEKNLDLIVEAFRLVRTAIPTACLWFVGSAHVGDKPWSIPKAANIRQIPWVSNAYPYIAGSDLLVSASRREGFGLALAEAMALGVPVVSVANRGAREIERQAPGRLQLAHSSPAAFARSMITALHRRQPRGLRRDLIELWSTDAAIRFHRALLKRVLCETNGSVGGS
jgi:glycosyltransferase EpsD